MTTRGPSLLVTALAGLLAVATSASAECAWVQWVMPTGPRAAYQPLSAFQTREQCVAHMSVASPGFVGKTLRSVAQSVAEGSAAYVDDAGRASL